MCHRAMLRASVTIYFSLSLSLSLSLFLSVLSSNISQIETFQASFLLSASILLSSDRRPVPKPRQISSGCPIPSASAPQLQLNNDSSEAPRAESDSHPHNSTGSAAQGYLGAAMTTDTGGDAVREGRLYAPAESFENTKNPPLNTHQGSPVARRRLRKQPQQVSATLPDNSSKPLENQPSAPDTSTQQEIATACPPLPEETQADTSKKDVSDVALPAERNTPTQKTSSSHCSQSVASAAVVDGDRRKARLSLYFAQHNRPAHRQRAVTEGSAGLSRHHHGNSVNQPSVPPRIARTHQHDVAAARSTNPLKTCQEEEEDEDDQLYAVVVEPVKRQVLGKFSVLPSDSSTESDYLVPIKKSDEARPPEHADSTEKTTASLRQGSTSSVYLTPAEATESILLCESGPLPWSEDQCLDDSLYLAPRDVLGMTSNPERGHQQPRVSESVSDSEYFTAAEECADDDDGFKEHPYDHVKVCSLGGPVCSLVEGSKCTGVERYNFCLCLFSSCLSGKSLETNM